MATQRYTMQADATVKPQPANGTNSSRRLPRGLTTLIATLAFCACAAAKPAEFYVSPQGSDSGAGTQQQPFATLEKARDALRALKSGSGLPEGGAVVWIQGGDYWRTDSFKVGPEDSGQPGKPIVYRAEAGATPRLLGGRLMPASAWKPLDAPARARVHPKVKAEQLLALPLAELGFKHLQPWPDTMTDGFPWSVVDLFADGERMPLSQWPNRQELIGKNEGPGWVTMNGSQGPTAFYYGAGGQPADKDSADEVNQDGTNRARRWQAAWHSGHGLWLKGFWRTPWQAHVTRIESMNLDQHWIKLAADADSGMGSKYSKVLGTYELPGPPRRRREYRAGSGRERWQLVNLLEEIDLPGEWALDFKDRCLYFYPPKPVGQLSLVIADNDQPLVQFSSAAHVQWLGLTMEMHLGEALRLSDCQDVLVAGCTIRNVAHDGLVVDDHPASRNVKAGASRRVVLQSNNISQTGGNGLTLRSLGDRKSLASSECVVTNNYIHHIGRLLFAEGMSLTECVGLNVAHNLIHDGPKRGVIYTKCNNCIFEFNEIHNIALDTSDMGAFYSPADWAGYGNVLRYNLLHHLKRANGMYLDDGESGHLLEYNVVFNAIKGVLVGGGHNNILRRNLFIKCGNAVSIDDRGITRGYTVEKYGKQLLDLHYDREPWKSAYKPQAKELNLGCNVFEDMLNPAWHPEYPNGCRAEDNVSVGSGPFVKPKGASGQKVTLRNNTELPDIATARFKKSSELDLRTDAPQILAKYPKLNEVLPQMGLVKDAYRSTLPSPAETGRWQDRGQKASLHDEDPDAMRMIKSSK